MWIIKLKYKLISILFFGTLCAKVYGQEMEKLSLQTCFDRAEDNSFLMERSMQKANSARESYEQQKTVALPEILGDAGGNSQFLSPYNFQQTWLLVKVDWSLGDLFMKTSITNQNRVLAFEAQREQVRLELRQRITLLYMSVLQSQVQIDLFNERLELLREHLLMAQALWQAGTQSEIDVLQTKTEITRIEEQVVNVEIQFENMMFELGKLIGKTVSDTFKVLPVLLDDLELQQIPVWSDTLIVNHPLMRTLNFQIIAENEKGRNIRAEQYPRFNMQTGYVSDADPTAEGNYWQILAGLNIPIFRWGRSGYQKQQLKADVQTLVMQREEVKRELNIHINQVLERLDKYRGLYLKQTERLEYSNQAFLLAEIHYQAGLLTNLEYLAVQQRYTETQISIQETKLRYGVNLVEFYVVTGQSEELYRLY